MKFYVPLIALLGLAACSASVAPTDPNAYRGYDVKVSDAGAAACGNLQASEVAVALKQTNALRARTGQPALSANPKLTKIAAQQACHMAMTGTMSHAGPGNEGPKQRAKAIGYQPRIIAENIAAGPYSLTQVVAQWEQSAAHRANSTLPAVREFGIGTATGPDGTRYWAAVYAGAK